MPVVNEIEYSESVLNYIDANNLVLIEKLDELLFVLNHISFYLLCIITFSCALLFFRLIWWVISEFFYQDISCIFYDISNKIKSFF